MYLHKCLSMLLGAYAQYTWVFHGAIIFVLASFFYWAQRKIIKHLLVRFEKTAYVWDDSIVSALSLPLSVLIWFLAIAFFGEYALIDFHQNDWSQQVAEVRSISLVLFLVWFVWRYIYQVEQRLMYPAHGNSTVDVTTVSVVGRFARIGLIVIGGLTLLEALGIPLGGVIAFGGGGAIVMGFAAQQLFANWFGGVIIFLDKPFKLGDWIQSPDKNIEGMVTRIGWRTTEVMSLDHRPLYIPNALFNQIVIVNPGRMEHRRLDITIGLRYDDAPVLQAIIKAIETMLTQHGDIDHSENMMVHLVNFGTSSLDINIYCFTRVTQNPHWRNVQQDILFKIIDIVSAHDAEFAYPTTTSHVVKNIPHQGETAV